MDKVVPILFMIFVIHLAVRAGARDREGDGIGLALFALLWGGLLPGAILLWFLYG
jgi:hypothetical protein